MPLCSCLHRQFESRYPGECLAGAALTTSKPTELTFQTREAGGVSTPARNRDRGLHKPWLATN
jgi:hypothetical protein